MSGTVKTRVRTAVGIVYSTVWPPTVQGYECCVVSSPGKADGFFLSPLILGSSVRLFSGVACKLWGTSMLVCSPCDPIGGVLMAECEDWLA